jgi:hypothetical protein
LLILRSTVYPGTTDWLQEYLSRLGRKNGFAFCPERVVQGYGVKELREMPQIISATTPEAEQQASALFRKIVPEDIDIRLEFDQSPYVSNAPRGLTFEGLLGAGLTGLDKLARTLSAPKGTQHVFDEDGTCWVDADSGFHLVPGFAVLEGTPVDPVLLAEGEMVFQQPGPPRWVYAEAEMAGEEVACPDGHTVVRFEAHEGRSRSAAPDNCGLEAPYVWGEYLNPGEAPVAAAAPEAAEESPEELKRQLAELRTLLAKQAPKEAPQPKEVTLPLASEPEKAPAEAAAQDAPKAAKQTKKQLEAAAAAAAKRA